MSPLVTTAVTRWLAWSCEVRLVGAPGGAAPRKRFGIKRITSWHGAGLRDRPMLFAILPLHVVVLAGTVPAPPVEVHLFDANHREDHVVEIQRDGTVDADTRKELKYAFRCRRSLREKNPAPGLLAMIAAVQEHWPTHEIEYI